MDKKYQNFFLKNGYIKIKLKQKNFNYLSKKIKQIVKLKLNTKTINLNNFHKKIKLSHLNDIRLHIFKKINENKKFTENAYLSAEYYINKMVGSELSCSDINLSIQQPGDDTSLLEMHTDFFSGESLFQVNLWIPFVDVKKTQSMFIINPLNSVKIVKKKKNDKKLVFNDLYKKFHKKLKWIKLKKGEAILFSPNCLHGNVVNREINTRWSINMRFKNLYSPENMANNEKKLGSFYKTLNPKIITLLNLKYDFDEITS